MHVYEFILFLCFLIILMMHIGNIGIHHFIVSASYPRFYYHTPDQRNLLQQKLYLSVAKTHINALLWLLIFIYPQPKWYILNIFWLLIFY